MSRRANVTATVTSSLGAAEQRLRDILLERPSAAERMSKAVATRRNLLVAVVMSVLWLLANHALGARAGIDLDPFPFHWLQRALVGSSLALAMIAARAHRARQRRLERLIDAQRDVEEATRWAATSRTLQIMARSHTAPD